MFCAYIFLPCLCPFSVWERRAEVSSLCKASFTASVWKPRSITYMLFLLVLNLVGSLWIHLSPCTAAYSASSLSERSSSDILAYSWLYGGALGFAYFDRRPHQQCGLGSYDARFAICCSCCLEIKEWTGLNKPLAWWRMDADQEGIEIGEGDSTGDGEE